MFAGVVPEPAFEGAPHEAAEQPGRPPTLLPQPAPGDAATAGRRGNAPAPTRIRIFLR